MTRGQGGSGAGVSVNRYIAVTTASALASASALLKMLKFLKILNLWMDLDGSGWI